MKKQKKEEGEEEDIDAQSGGIDWEVIWIDVSGIILVFVDPVASVVFVECETSIVRDGSACWVDWTHG